MTGKKFALIGTGKFGSRIASQLACRGAEVYAFDCDEEKIENIKDDVALAVTLDATDLKALRSQNVDDVDAAIVAIGENFEAVILATVNLLELNVKRVIARASGEHQKKILSKLGVSEILTPEEEVASAVTEKLINPSIVSFLELPDDYEIAEIKAPRGIVNRSIREIDFRNKYKLTLVTLKREFDSASGEGKEFHVLGVPTSQTTIQETDTCMVFGTVKDVARFIEVNQ